MTGLTHWSLYFLLHPLISDLSSFQAFKDTLYVTVVRAEDLPRTKKGEVCNPYVKLFLLPRHRYHCIGHITWHSTPYMGTTWHTRYVVYHMMWSMYIYRHIMWYTTSRDTLYSGSRKRKTKVKNKTLNPIFDELFKFTEINRDQVGNRFTSCCFILLRHIKGGQDT